MAFTYTEPLPGVYHIRDALGVCMTLLCGEERALLADTGYGLEDVSAFVRTLTDKPLTVMLTHHHHDHVLGARWFPETVMFEEDLPAFSYYTSEAMRRRVLASAKASGIHDEGDLLGDVIPPPLPLRETSVNLGHMTARLLQCPGHTPGSAVIHVPERRLLLTADTWNPCTWIFFPEALGVRAYLAHARALLALPFDYVLCSHRESLYPRETFVSFLTAATDETLRKAKRVVMPPHKEIDTRCALLPGGQELVFDWAKFA